MHDINDMMVFLAVVEAKSFRLAAQRLQMPKANVSRKVSRLESHLGVKLLERSTRSQHLTEAGRRYLTHCKRIHTEVDLANAAVSELLHSVTGNIKIGTSVSIGQQIISDALPQFMERFPKLAIELNLLNKRVDLIEEGYDLLIRAGKLDDSRFIGKRLGLVTISLYASPYYIEAHPLPTDIADLPSEHALLVRQYTSNNTLTLHANHKRHILQIQPRLFTDDFSIVKQASIEGLGFTLLPDYLCTDAVQGHKLVKIFPEWRLPAVEIYALYPQHRMKIPKLRAFLEFIVAIFKHKLA